MDKVLGGSIKLCSGALMPLMGFGTFRLTEPDTVFKAIDWALGTGYCGRPKGRPSIVTTNDITHGPLIIDIGKSLKILLAKHNLDRKDIFLTTKVMCPADQIKNGIDDSLSRLQTDYIDLVLLHFPMPLPWSADRPNSPESTLNKVWRKEAWFQLEKLTEEGKIRSIGVSNYEPHHLAEMTEYSTVPPAVNQIELHPHFTRDAIVAKCKEMNIHVQAFTSLGRNHPDLMGVSLLNEIAQKHQATVPQVLLSWAMELGYGVVPKSENENRIRSNFQAVHLKLDKEEIKEISQLNRNKPYSNCKGWEVI